MEPGFIRSGRAAFTRWRQTLGQLKHVVTLPGDVDPGQVDANLSAGVLTVRLGKARRSQPRRIEIRES